MHVISNRPTLLDQITSKRSGARRAFDENETTGDVIVLSSAREEHSFEFMVI